LSEVLPKDKQEKIPFDFKDVADEETVTNDSVASNKAEDKPQN
jgi:hypothetical protein